jgi:glycosyltransferase involved in cell wall biosynthesis
MKDNLEGYGYFIQEVFGVITAKYPQHDFYFLFDRPFHNSFVFNQNVHPIVVAPPARHPILWKYWYDIKIPRVLKQIEADVFVSPDGFCSLTTKVPQCMVVHDLGFLHRPDAYKKSHALFYKLYTPKFLKKAMTIATVSGFSKNDLINRYKVPAEKIYIVPNAVKACFKPLGFEDRQLVKEQYTGGREYFIYVGAIHPRKNLINLLKAFSAFKKRLQSNMKLVLAGRLAWKNDEFLQLLKTYKYRDDVILTDYLPEKELARLTAAAYALVYPSLFEGFGVPVLEAMKCDVPALSSSNSSMQEVAGDAGLYFDPNSQADIADKLMLIYKDENLRKTMIEKGRAVAARYSWEHSAEMLWQAVMKAMGNIE